MTPTLEAQRLAALDLANHVRTARAQLKVQLKSRVIEIADVLADPPQEVETARIDDILKAAPKFGPGKVARVLRHANIQPSSTVGHLTVRQRTLLIGLVREITGRLSPAGVPA